MKKIFGVFCFAIFVLCLCATEMDARGGRSGGASKSRPSSSRSPAASRSAAGRSAASRPAAGTNRQPGVASGRPAQRSSSRNTREFLNLPHAAAANPIAGHSGVGRSAVAHSGHVDRNRINQQHANRYAGVANRPFNPGWHGWQAAHLPAYWHHRHNGHYRPGYWWRWATVGAVSAWIIYDWANPAYYAYGPGGNVYYEGDTVYVNGQPAYSGEEYYQQAADIADNVPKLAEEKAKQIEWMPLGVFAVVQDKAKESGLMLQLAVSKEGIISGTMFNEPAKSVRAVEGMVDKKTQRAVWSFVDDKKPKCSWRRGSLTSRRKKPPRLFISGRKIRKFGHWCGWTSRRAMPLWKKAALPNHSQ